jgi:hypothetical protein
VFVCPTLTYSGSYIGRRFCSSIAASDARVILREQKSRALKFSIFSFSFCRFQIFDFCVFWFFHWVRPIRRGLLADHVHKWGDFYDVRVTSVEPAGPAVVGQTVFAESGPRLLHLALEFRFTKIDAVKYELGLDVRLPFGVTVYEDLNCYRTRSVPRQLPLWLRLSDGMARYGRAHAHASRAQRGSG